MNIYIIFVALIMRILVITCKKENVILFILDDLRPALNCFGDKNAFTPHIDKIAYNGIIFKNAFAQQALCAPSRNSFLTSRRPDTLHLYDFYNYWRTFSGNFTTLPQFFKENGYHTISIGKVFHPGISSNYSDDEEYSWSEKAYHPPSEMYKDAKVCMSKGKSSPQANLVCPVVTRSQPGGTLPDIQSKEKAVAFLNSYNSSGKPFFLALGFHKPHIPLKYPTFFKKYHPLKDVVLPMFRRRPPDLPDVAWNPWTDIRERDDIKELNISVPFGVVQDKEAKLIMQSYYGSVSYVDSLIGEVVASLKGDLKRNTILALIGDHGWSLGDHGEWSKYSNFDVATRVPLILRIPGLTTSNRYRGGREELAVSQPVELLDLFPTLVDLAGLKSVKKCISPRKEMLCTEGKSLVPLIMDVMASKNNKIKKGWKMIALSQYPRPGDYPTEHPNSDKPKLKEITVMGCSLRTSRYRYTEWLGFKNLSIIWEDIHAAELYDHKMDPNESINLVRNLVYSTVRKKLSLLLRNKWNFSM